MRNLVAGNLFRLAAMLLLIAPWATGEKQKQKLSPLERYIQEARAQAGVQQPTAGSLYVSSGLLGNVACDLQARQVNDIVTIVVADKASAVSRGVTATSRKSSSKASIGSLFGSRVSTGLLSNLANLGGANKLDGEGATSRETLLTTTISARVTRVLPNGYLVLEGDKDIWVNSEHQQVTVRGIVRWSDIGAGNEVSSDRLANLEVRVNGKGVVGDAIHRPNFLFRFLLGLLPF